MLTEDFDLQTDQIQSLSDADALASFFSSLGYQVERVPQTTEALGITNDKLKRHIQDIEQIALQDAQLYVYLFEMKSLRVTDRQALARAFKNLSGEFLLVLTDRDYDTLDFVLLERVQPRDSAGKLIPNRDPQMKQHVLSVDRRDPGRVAKRVLQRFTYTESEVFFQLDKLKSAYKIARWSRPMFNNLALFSDYYLENRLQDAPEWQEPAVLVYRALSGLFVSIRERLTDATEEDTRAALLEPTFRELGFDWRVAQSSGKNNEKPDYVLTAQGDNTPLAYALTYRWNRYLDGRDLALDFDPGLDADKIDDNPGARVVSLLASDDAPPYVIVTNGKLWRIYAREAHSRSTNYYEIDLEETLADPDRDVAFRYFWLFFRAQAFVATDAQASFLDRVMEGSSQYAKQLEKQLKDRVFESIFPQFAEGFIRDGWKEQAPQQDDLDAVYQATLTFLYRLMFLLYAEARDLLPVKEAHGYGANSLRAMTDEIAGRAGVVLESRDANLRGAYSASEITLYDRLTHLFEVIDRGDATMNVPNYNGGLFLTDPDDDDPGVDAANARFLRDTKIPDRWLAAGLDALARDQGTRPGEGLVAIDYKSLGVRQLGSIYEGLLEFKLRIAPEKMAIVKDKKTEKYVPYRQAKKKDILTTGRGAAKQERTLPKGTVYIENDKQERKATGSYYTPDYIVSYIVEHTVGPVLDEKFAALTPRLRDAEKAFHQWSRNNNAKQHVQEANLFWNDEKWQRLAADILDVKVLDPAMGSGHFLVEVVDYVTDRTLRYLDRFRHNPVTAQLQRVRRSILDNLDEQNVSVDEGRLTDVNLLKRQVLKRCVYGVDLNRMAVELAKVSLWLDAFTLGAPLSFLDHHLRWGNSLIGTTAREADRKLSGEGRQQSLFSGPFVGLLRAAEIMRGVSALADATIEEAHRSADLFGEFERAAKPYKQLLDVFVIQHFGVEKASEFLKVFGPDAINMNYDDFKPVYQKVLDERARLHDEHRFFHWDLEFPEVFIDLESAAWKENAGFDAVVGNPPYVRQEELTPQKPYFKESYDVYSGMADLFLYFYELALTIVQRDRRMGYITSGTFMNSNSAKPFRAYIHENAAFEHVANFGENQPFEGAEMVYPTVAIMRAGEPKETFRSLFIEGAVPFSELPKAFSNGEWVESLSETTAMEEWRFQAAELSKLFSKIINGRTALRDLIGEHMYRGVTTGLNDVFVINEHLKAKLIDEHESSAEIIKPMLRGQDLRPWYQVNSREYLIFTRYGVDIGNYPAIERYLTSYREQLEPKPADWKGRWFGRKSGAYQWYEIQDRTAYYEAFEETKIWWAEIAKLPRFSWDEDGLYASNKAHMAVTSDKSVLSVLNSRTTWFVLSQISVPLRLRGGLWQYQLTQQFVERVPLPDLTTQQKTDLAAIAEEITSLARARYAMHEAMRADISAAFAGGEEIGTRVSLYRWWELDGVDGLEDEVKSRYKAKIKRRGEWEKKLAAGVAEHGRLTDEIIALEVRLNDIVYDAFDLTPEERVLIEETTKYPYGAI